LGKTDFTDPFDNSRELSTIKICTSVPNLDKKKEENYNTRKVHTLAMINDEYPPEKWIHVYTDGSATDAVKDGGAGVLIQCPDGCTETASVSTGVHCSIYRAESEAILTAISKVEDLVDESSCVVFLTDSLSVIQALTNRKLPQLARALHQLNTACRVAIQWIPAHCGIPGNEKADKLAKQGAKSEQTNTSVSYSEKVAIIKALMKPKPEKDAYHQLDRPEQVTIVRLRSGHNRLNSHMYRKYKLVQSPLCPCGEEEQTTEHVLQRCMRYNQQRTETWPSAVPLNRKLHGDVEDLKKTAKFIEETGLTV
jgi:ribonuclease HI